MEIEKIDTQIRLRCVSPIGLSSSMFVLTGGTVSHVWEVENRATGQREQIGAINTKVLSPSSNVLQASTSGSGIRLATSGISATLIESANIDGGENNYLVNLRLNIVYNLKFNIINPTPVSNTAVGALVSQIGSNAGEFLTVSQEIVNPPDPSSNIVDITATKTIPSPMFKSDPSPQVKITVDLPLWDSANESFPRVNIFQPTFDGSLTATTYLNNIALTGRSGTIFSSTIDLPGTLKIGHYLVEATSSTRTGSDSAIFTIYADDQDPMTDVPVSPCENARDGYTANDGRFLTGGDAAIQCALDQQENPPPDPCEGLTGNALDSCRGIVEQFSGCSQGFIEQTRSEFLEIVSVIGQSGNIVIQSGFTTNDDPICVSNETVATFEILRDQQVSGENTCNPDGTPLEDCFADTVCTALLEVASIGVEITNTCDDPIFDSGHACFGLTVEQCLQKCIANPESCTIHDDNGQEDTTGVEDKITATLISGEANPVIFYQIVYDGGDEKGIIDLESQQIDFSVLQFAGVPAEKTEFFELKRIIVIPAIDITPILSSINTVQASPDFKYTWSAEIIKLDGTKKNAVLETCHNTCSKLTMTTQGVQIKSSIIGVNLCADEKLTATEKIMCEDAPEKTFYQIGSSDIQPNELDKAFADAFPNTILEQGDLVTIKVEIEGSFKPKIDGVVNQAVITPMEWSHAFTWIPQFGDDKEPCATLSGQAQLDCEGNPIGKSDACKDLTANECNMKLPPKDPSGCKDTVVGDKIIRLCYGLDDEGADAGSFGGDTIGSKGSPGILGIAECPEGTTATDCADILLEILEQRLAGILGISGSTITAISNNAVLIIGSIIAILVIAIIARIALKAKLRRSGF